MADMIELETIYVVFNADGETIVHTDRDTAIENFNEEGYCGPYRVIEFTIQAVPPKDIEVSVEIPYEEENTVTIKAV